MAPRMLIGGELVSSENTMEVVNPATGEVIATVPRASATDVDSAVQAARTAFPAWAARDVEERKQVLLAMADALEAHAEELGRLVTLEQGKPLAGAAMESAWSPGVLRYYASLDYGPEVLQDDDAQNVELHRRPLGVVAAIVPWNFPLLMAVYKMAPALIMGNTFVVKASPTTPLAALRMGEILAEVVPAGVVNILTDGGDIGPILTEHPGVAKVSFTGSTATGRKVLASVAATLKRVTLELGGNDAAIVLEDADVEQVAPAIFSLAFLNSGQVCMGIKRIFVHDSKYDEMCQALAKLADGAVVGDGLDPATEFGPVQNAAQFERTKEAIDIAHRDGTVIAGGVTSGPGYFVRPTLVRDVSDTSPIVTEEVFGPVRVVLSYSSVDEAVARANASQYGLGASVWGADVAHATEVACRLEAGSAWVNQHFAVAPHIPFGGMKQSGIGREFGAEGLHEYADVQVVVVAKTPVA